MNHASNTAISYYNNWPLWAVVLLAAIAILLSIATALGNTNIGAQRSAVTVATSFLSPPLAVLSTWQVSMHTANGKNALALYLALLAGLIVAAYRTASSFDDARIIRLIVIAISAGGYLWAGTWELLRRIASTIPTSISGLIAMIFLGTIILWGISTENG